MNVTLNVRKASVLLTNATDKIVLYLDMDSPYPKVGDKPSAIIDAAHDCGVDWCIKNLGVTPEIINCR